MSSTEGEIYFEAKPRREDPGQGVITVQRNVEFLANLFRKFRDAIKQGTATITTGNTFVDVTHGLNKVSYRVMVMPTADPGGRVWVSNKTSSAMRINISSAAGSNIPFDWIVRGD